MNDKAETEEKERDPILSYPSVAQTHDELRQLRRRGFIRHNSSVDGQRKVRDGQIRGKAAVKQAKRDRRTVREVHRDIVENGI